MEIAAFIIALLIVIPLAAMMNPKSAPKNNYYSRKCECGKEISSMTPNGIEPLMEDHWQYDGCGFGRGKN